MKTGTIYKKLKTVATNHYLLGVNVAGKAVTSNQEVGFVSARSYLGEEIGEYVVSTKLNRGVALIVRTFDGYDVFETPDPYRDDVRRLLAQALTWDAALAAALGVAGPLRVGN